MSNDTHVREFLERMANEIYIPPLDWRSPVKRARRHRSITMAVVVVIVTAIVTGGSVGLRSLTDTRPRPANESTHPLVPLIHNGSIGVSGWMNGVRSLTPDGAGNFLFECNGSCSHVVADWSRDGTRLAFTTTCGPNCTAAGDPYNGIHVVDLVRGTDRLVVPGNGAGELAWSPDGTRIAYVKYQEHTQRIFVMNEDGSGQKPVIPSTGSGVGSLSWSPDGTRIAFTDAADRLFVVGLDGSAPSDLGVDARGAAWSPDGTTIAYFSGDYPALCDVRETTPDGHRDFSLVDLSRVSKRCDYGGDLEWSPDGTELAALAYHEVAPRKGFAAVFLVKADGSSARSFTSWTAGWPWDGLAWQPVP